MTKKCFAETPTNEVVYGKSSSQVKIFFFLIKMAQMLQLTSDRLLSYDFSNSVFHSCPLSLFFWSYYKLINFFNKKCLRIFKGK
jgi:hypothetical protein